MLSVCKEPEVNRVGIRSYTTMSHVNRVDWNDLIEEKDYQNCQLVDYPPSTPSPTRATSPSVSEDSREDRCEKDVLDLYCDDNDVMCEGADAKHRSPDKYASRRRSESEDKENTPSDNTCQTWNGSSPEENYSGNSCSRKPTGRRFAHPPSTRPGVGPYKREYQTPARKQRRRRHPLSERQDLPAYNTIHRREIDKWVRSEYTSQPPRPLSPSLDHGVSGKVRWIRHGYEGLVSDIIHCSERPNVVFAALCYLDSDVYTMVLRNCDGKRRYWYDRPTRRAQLSKGTRVDGFERAMRWRANVVGRVSTSPGYDLAAFVLQNVATDKRSLSVPSPITVVTTDSMMDDPEIHHQLVHVRNPEAMYRSQQDRRHFSSNHARCYVCEQTSGIVIHDNASVPTYTCWNHSASYMAGASADSTRICNAVVVGIEFHREESPGSEMVCRMRLIQNGSGEHSKRTSDNSSLTIAEIVRPSGFEAQGDCRAPGSSFIPIDLNTAHSYVCRDRHFNVEDLFPSLPNGTQYYDSRIGSIVDLVHCVASTFQK